jgi:predicted DNA-binding protein (UPF0251 family)
MTIRVRGVDYENAQAAAEALGMSPKWLQQAERRGRLDKVGKRVEAISRVASAFPLKVRRKTFQTLEECAAHFKISRQAIKAAIRNGRAQFIGIPAHKTRKRHGVDPMPVKVAGVLFNSAKEAGEALGVSEITVRTAINSGREAFVGKGLDRSHAARPSQPFRVNAIPVEIGPHRWPSIVRAASDLGVHVGTLRVHIRANDAEWLKAKAMIWAAKKEAEARAARMKEEREAA